MYPVSEEFKKRLKQSHTVVSRVDVYNGDTPLVEGLAIERGYIHADSTAANRRRCDVVIGDPGAEQTHKGHIGYKGLMLNKGPIAYWRLGEKEGTTAKDSSGNDNHGGWLENPNLGVSGLLADDHDLAVEIVTKGDGRLNGPVSAFPTGDEVSIVIWTRFTLGSLGYGATLASAENSVDGRQLNIHLPWTGNNVYWDAGGVGGSYDRINKAATDAELVGIHQWVFTKNAITGNMRIYLDGVLWHSGTGKTRTVKSINSGTLISTPTSGVYDEYAFLDKELTADEVKESYEVGRALREQHTEQSFTLTPEQASDLLHPLSGNELHIYRGIRVPQDGYNYPYTSKTEFEENSVQGDWVGNYGDEGYVLAAWNDTSSDLLGLPSGVTFALTSGARFRWNGDSSHPRALEAPDESVSKETTWYHSSGTLVLTLTFDVPWVGLLSLYSMEGGGTNTRRQDVTIKINNVVVATAQEDREFPDGVWAHFPIQVKSGDIVRMEISKRPDSGSNTVASGIFLTNQSFEKAYNDELVPQGVFGIEDCNVDDQGESISISVKGFDRSKRVQRARWTDLYFVAQGTNVATAIRGILENRMPSIVCDWVDTEVTTETTPPLVYGYGGWSGGGDPWEHASKLAQSIGYELYFGTDGKCKLEPVPDPAVDPVVWTYQEGPDNLLLFGARTLTRDEVFNHVIAFGLNTATDTPIRVEAIDDNPNSPTRIDGPFGDVPTYYRSTLLLTSTQAQAAAEALLREKLGTPEQVRFISIVNPAHEVGDVVQIERERAGITGTHIIDKLTIPLGAMESMNATCRERRV